MIQLKQEVEKQEKHFKRKSIFFVVFQRGHSRDEFGHSKMVPESYRSQKYYNLGRKKIGI